MENELGLKSKDELRADELRRIMEKARRGNAALMATLAEERKNLKKEPVTTTPKSTPETSISLFVTAKLREDLKSHGVTDKEIDALKPEEAWELLKQKNSTKETGNIKPKTSEATQETEKKTEETEQHARKIIKEAKDIIENLPLSPKKLEEKKARKVKKEGKTQGDLKIMGDKYAKIKEDLERAEKALAEAQKEKTESPKEKKKPFYRNKWLQVGALTALLATDVGITGKKSGWWESNAPTGKTEQKNNIKKETAGIYTSTVTNLSTEVEKIKAEEIKNKAESDKKLADQQAEIDAANQRTRNAEEMSARIKAQMQAEKSAPVVQPKTITREELLAGIEQKINLAIKEGKDVNTVLTSDEARMWNIHLINDRSVIRTGNTIQTGGTEIKTLPKTPDQPPAEQGRKITGGSVDAGGFNYVFSSNPNGINFDTPAKIHPNENTEKNPFNLTPKMLEKVEEVYENNIDKIFPNDTLQNWKSIKDKSADEFMGKPESKIKKIQKPLYDYLKQLEETTKLKPKSGILRDKPESIETYMERALQKSAQDGKLDTVELK